MMKTTDSLVMSDNTATNTMLSEKSMVTKVTDKMDSNRKDT